ncbi:MAG: DUF4878 domain-containing protein [Treponema sp.]|nr:DUF4878 domain-containing protein [Treponema sp.]
MTAAEKGDAAAFDKTCTPETASLLKAFANEEKFKTMIAKNGKITRTQETIDGDTARVAVSFENAEDQTIDLVKVDGKWKIVIKK